MARSSLTWLHAAAVATLAAQAAAQTCYYPNGKAAPDTEKPCSNADGAACCPDTWECLDNGLCHNPNGNLYGRYSCTDKSWKAPGCASNMCTYGGTAYGGESITQCSNHNNDWCCNADAVHVNCCQESPEPRPFFRLQDGMAYATIGRNQASSQPTLATNTGLASGSGSGGGSSASKTDAAVSSAPTSSARPITSESTSVSSGPGGVSTVINTVIVTPASNPTGSAGSANSASPSTDGDSGSKSNIGLIVGLAVGIPMALALAGIIFWILRKRRNQKTNPYKNSPEMDGEGADSPAFAGGAAAKLSKPEKYRHSRPGTTEIDGAPAGPGRPISHIPGRAELDSGAGFQPGHGTAFAPDTVGIGGGNGDGRSTWGSAPPGYSPSMNQTGFHHQHNVSELDGTSAMPVINEKAAAAPQRQQYQAYRPPRPAAELPTIKTPPEDLEKQLPK